MLKPYSLPQQIHSSLVRKTPDSIPLTSDLELLHEELKELKKLSLARAKKAGDDMKTIEESMRRMKEKEKGKAKLVEKVKRERDCTFISSATLAQLVPQLGSALQIRLYQQILITTNHVCLLIQHLPYHPLPGLPSTLENRMRLSMLCNHLTNSR
jgi:hypothetical protein